MMSFDADLLLRNGSLDGNLTANANGTAIDYSQAGHMVLTFEMVVPSVSGSTPTLDMKVQVSDDASVWRDWLIFRQVTAPGVYHVSGASPARYRRYVAALGGTTPNFGPVTLGAVPAGYAGKF